MDKAPTFVGIDVAKRRLDIHSRPSGERFAVDHDDGSVAALVETAATSAGSSEPAATRRSAADGAPAPGRCR